MLSRVYDHLYFTVMVEAYNKQNKKPQLLLTTKTVLLMLLLLL